MDIPIKANVIVIGGGVIGCSVAYHLSKRGIEDVVLIERQKISSGTSWHAAGILSAMRPSESMARMCKETTEIFSQLQNETGIDILYKNVGCVFVTSLHDRYEQFKKMISVAKCFDVASHIISPQEAKEKWPLLNIDDIIGAAFIPSDSLVCPERSTMALSKGAQKYGTQIFEDLKVQKLIVEKNKVVGVVTEKGEIRANKVVVTSGIWTRDFCAQHNVNVPLQATEHYYVLTDNVEGVDPMMPLLRDFDARVYVRPTVGTRWHNEGTRLMCGFFERNAHPIQVKDLPEDFAFGRLNEDREHLEEVLGYVKHRIPILKNARIETILNGPESFTYDNSYFMGETPQIQGLYVAAGYCSRGIQSSGGVGKVMADWIIRENTPHSFDLHDVNVSRAPGFTANKKYLHERSREILGLLYDIHYPFLQVETARPVRVSPFHTRLAERRACFGELAGWERANWYAPEGSSPQYKYSFQKQNWFPYAAAEHMAVRENIGIFDQTSFGKFLVQGKDALMFLDKICGNKIDVPINKIVYTQILNYAGGIESDITVIRVDEEEFLIVTTATSQQRDYFLIKNHIKKMEVSATITDITSAYSVISIMGPNSRALMKKMTDADLSNELFPFGTSQIIDFGYARVRANRITFVGELGWEIFIPMEFSLPVYDVLMKEADILGAKLAGYHAMNSLRLEKCYIHWGHDVCECDTPIEAGVGFTVKTKKTADFLGKDILIRQKNGGVNKRLLAFTIEDNDALLDHYEPIYRNGEMVGHITSGMFSPLFNKSIGLGWIHDKHNIIDDKFVLEAKYKINILNEDYSATPSIKPLYDPKMEKIRSNQ